MKSDIPTIIPKGEKVSAFVFAPLARPFDYIAHDDLQIGDLVEVPFGTKSRKAVIWGQGESEGELKTTKARLDYPPMTEAMREFVGMMAQYTITPLGQILPMLYRAPEPLAPKPNALRVVEGYEGKLSPKRQTLFDKIQNAGVLFLEEVDASKAVIKGLIDEGAAEYLTLKPQAQKSAAQEMILSDEQARALNEIETAEKPVLLKGITGSGKTEVYLGAIEKILTEGAQALILLPEIALTRAFLERFEARFGVRAGHWHSDMGVSDRRRIWHGVASGEIPVVIGARSALFLPFKDLRLIVVDEEHDRGFKQEEGVIYHGRDMAVLRALFEKAKVILASATPSIESMVNAEQGRYQRVDLVERFGSAELPEMRVADMRLANLNASEWISPLFEKAMRERMDRGEQSLLFLNRRGFAPLTLCRACGHQIACPNCDARLVEHRFQGGLHCHKCGFVMAIPKACPECGVEEKLVPIGPGVERLAEEVQGKLQDARISVFSSDRLRSEVELRAEIVAIERGDYDVIIGTQMIAKGHNFPELTFVGVVDADAGLEGADLRASETSFQILRQVAGRAGRYEKSGLAMVQTYQPDHPILRAILSADDRVFYEEEIMRRRAAGAPPFSRYAALVIWGNNLDEAMDFGRKLLQKAPAFLPMSEMQIWGPAPAPISRLRNRWRVRMLLKYNKKLGLHQNISNWINATKAPARIKVQVDVDPQSFL